MGALSIWHILIVGVLIILLFGKGKMSDFMGDLAKGIKSFKKGLADDEAAPPAQTVQPARPLPHEEPVAMRKDERVNS